jgi:hypothetical protein
MWGGIAHVSHGDSSTNLGPMDGQSALDTEGFSGLSGDPSLMSQQIDSTFGVFPLYMQLMHSCLLMQGSSHLFVTLPDFMFSVASGDPRVVGIA